MPSTRGLANAGRPVQAHELFDDLLTSLVAGRKLTSERIGEVLTRLMIAAPGNPPQSEIVRGEMLPMAHELTADSVSRTMAALTDPAVELVTTCPPRQGRAGRPFIPLRLG